MRDVHYNSQTKARGCLHSDLNRIVRRCYSCKPDCESWALKQYGLCSTAVFGTCEEGEPGGMFHAGMRSPSAMHAWGPLAFFKLDLFIPQKRLWKVDCLGFNFSRKVSLLKASGWKFQTLLSLRLRYLFLRNGL